ncbi:hypothetical protein PIROE2DRAFT_19128 [Piromyces sp. E2]|nr:hypothetical protein PIROE2DRAFT_19128 [Piromyces sp. E2]|eukprot:OUM56314.1 hypothetical protein PIROE2DRAFT_19128 [Piromyces sp. E2]
MPRPNQTDLLPFAKLFYASSSYIKNEIILPAFHDLQEYLHEVELEEQAARLSNIIIVSEIPYIQMALNKVVEESKVFPDLNMDAALKLLSKEEKKEIFKDTYASRMAGKTGPKASETESTTQTHPTKSEVVENKKTEVKQWGKEMTLQEKKYQEKMEKEGGFEPAFSDDEDNDNKKKPENKKSTNNFDGQFVLNNNNFYQSYSQENLDENVEENKDKNKKKDNDGDDGDENDENNKENKESTFSQTIPSEKDSDSDNVYYFYQMADGQHYYLHPLCNKILKYEYGEYSRFPETLNCRILSLKESTINEDMRKRFKYLSHLPLTCDIVLCEIYLNDIVSSSTFKKFKPEITQLSKKRQQKMAKDNHKNKESNLKNEWMNLYKSLESSAQESNKSQPLLYEPINDDLLYPNGNKKKNNNNSQEYVPAALSQEAIDFLKNEQKKKAANSFAKIASSSSSNVTFSPWQGNKSTPKKKNLMVNGNEWVVSKDNGWSLDFDELVEDSDNDTPKQKELTISDIINSTKGKGKGKEKETVKETVKENTVNEPSSQTIEVDKNHELEELKGGKDTTPASNSKNNNNNNNNGKLGKKKSKKVIMISNGGQRRRY